MLDLLGPNQRVTLSSLLIMASLPASPLKAPAASGPEPTGLTEGGIIRRDGPDNRPRSENGKDAIVATRKNRTFSWDAGWLEERRLFSLDLTEGSAEERADKLLALFHELNSYAAASAGEKEELSQRDSDKRENFEWLLEHFDYPFTPVGTLESSAAKVCDFLSICRTMGIEGRALRAEGRWLAALKGEFKGHALQISGENFYLADPDRLQQGTQKQRIGDLKLRHDFKDVDLCLNITPLDQEIQVRSPDNSIATLTITEDDLNTDYENSGQFSSLLNTEEACELAQKMWRGGIGDSEILFKLREEISYNLNGLVAVPADPVVDLVRALTRDLSNPEDCAASMLKWVQSEIRYTPDGEHLSGVMDVNQSPLQTLYSGRGECLDSSILLASMCSIAGMDCCIVIIDRPGFNDHAVLGIKGNFKGSRIKHEGEYYYLAETTGEGVKIGSMPVDFKGSQVLVIPIQEEP